MYDWILDKPLFPVDKGEITLYPFLIEQTKGSDFVSYKVLSLWDSIGSDSSGTNITNIAGFKSAYKKGSNLSVELEDYGVLTINKDLKIKKDNDSYNAVSNKGNLEITITKENDKQVIKYNDYQNNEVVFEIDYSSDKSTIVKKYVNHRLTIYSKIKKDTSTVTINSVFSGQKLTEFKKIGKSSYLASLGSFFETDIDKNITKVKTSGKVLNIIKDEDERIVSIKLVNNGKTEYTEDYEFFEDYTLITKFDVMEKIQTEIELGFNDIILYEVKKNVEDVIFYEYTYDTDSERAIAHKYFTGEKIAEYNYDLSNGVKELIDVKYFDEEEECETVKKYDKNGKEKIEIKRNSSSVFTVKTSDEFYKYDPYPNINGGSGNIKNSRLKSSSDKGGSVIENDLAGVKIKKQIQPDNFVSEEIDFSRGYSINRRYSHSEYSYDDKLINNPPYQFKNERQFKIGIGSNVVENSLDKEMIKKYNSQGKLISKRISSDTLFWNSLYGYNNNSLSVIKDMVNGALTFISIFSKAENFIEKITYDKSSSEIKEIKLSEGLEHLIKLCGKAVQLTYDNNIITQNLTNQSKGIPLVEIQTKLTETKTDKMENLLNVESRKYKIGLVDYSESIDFDKNGEHTKTIKNGREEYQELKFNKYSELEKVKIYGSSYKGLFKEAQIQYDRDSLPNKVEIKRKNKSYSVSPNFKENGAKFDRNISKRDLNSEVELISGDDKVKTINIK